MIEYINENFCPERKKYSMRRYLSNAQLRNISFSFKFLKSRNSYPLQIFINAFFAKSSINVKPNHPLLLVNMAFVF